MEGERIARGHIERDSRPCAELGYRVLRRLGPEPQPYYITEVEAQLLSYDGSEEVQRSILADFERGEAYVE